MRTITGASLLAIGSLLVGCASTPEVVREEVVAIPEGANYSLAMQVAIATKLTDPVEGPLFDLPRSELPEELRDVPNVHAFSDFLDKSIYTVGVIGGAKGLLGTTGEITNSGNLAFMALGLLTHVGSLPHPAIEPQIIAWMPTGGAPETRAAALPAEAEFKSMLETAAIAALPDGMTAERRTTVFKPKMGPAKSTDRVFVTGIDGCAGIEDQCILWTLIKSPARAVDLNGGASWYWRNWHYGAKANTTEPYAVVPAIRKTSGANYNLEARLSFEDPRSFALRLSANLPQWVYIYYPPSEDAPAVMFNQGAAHYFIEPIRDE